MNFSICDNFSFHETFISSSSSVIVDPISKINNDNIPIDTISGTDDIVRIFSFNLDYNSNYDCATIVDRGTPVNIMNLETVKKLNLLIFFGKNQLENQSLELSIAVDYEMIFILSRIRNAL